MFGWIMLGLAFAIFVAWCRFIYRKIGSASIAIASGLLVSLVGSALVTAVLYSFTPDGVRSEPAPREEQRKVAQVELPAPSVVAAAPSESKSERGEDVAKTIELPKRKPFKEVRALALKGDYQAQRNLAYGYSSNPYDGQDMNPILACAWRTVIILSGSEKVNETDIGNQEVYCGKLTAPARAAADAQAYALLQKIE